MEDQGKRLMLAVAIAFGIMMAWSVLFPPEQPPEEAAKKDTTEQVDKSPGDAKARRGHSDSIDDAGSEAVDPEDSAVVERGEEVFFDLEFDNLHARFSSYGAALSSWQLLSERLTDRSGKTPKPEDIIRVHEEDYQFLRVWFPDSTYDIPRGAEWSGEKLSHDEIRFTWKSEDMRVVKTIKIHPDDYLLVMKVSLELVGAKSAKQSLALSLYGQQDTDVESGGMFARVEREWKAACYYNDEIHSKSSKSLEKGGEKKRTGQIDWGGFDHAYFLVAGAVVKGSDKERIDCDSYPLQDVAGGMGLDLVQSSVDLKNGEPGLKSTMAFYLGPKYIEKLRAANVITESERNFERAVDLGWLGMISGPLLWLLNFFQGYVGNWGIAILLLTIVVKGLTLPWTHKSMKSMKEMAKLKPQLEKIKEKHKDDRAKQNVETMALFKSHKVNPMSGCLPMLLQMPIWFALYRALTVAGQLYQAPFVPGWIDDLTLPDPFYIMPVLLTGMMFLQTRMTPSTGTGAQQKMLMYGMPIMFGAFSFFFPSGLTLYIFTNTCFTALHHLYMHKTDPAPVAAKASASAAGKVIDVEEVSASDAPGDSKESQSAKSAGSKGKKKSSGKGKGKGKGPKGKGPKGKGKR